MAKALGPRGRRFLERHAFHKRDEMKNTSACYAGARDTTIYVRAKTKLFRAISQLSSKRYGTADVLSFEDEKIISLRARTDDWSMQQGACVPT